MVVGVVLPMSPLAEYFKLQALPTAFFPWLAAILLSYGLTATLMKRFYIHRFGWQ
jgi:Mg2+-importing ATPase